MNRITHAAPLAILAALAGCKGNVAEPVAEPRNFTAELHCGALPLKVSGAGEQLTADLPGRQLALQQAVSASGARYVATDETDTSLWFKGEQATLVVDGMEYPRCAPANALVEPFRASGNEPFWSLVADDGQMTLNRLNEGELPAQRYTAGEQAGDYLGDGEPPLKLRVRDGLCRDDMSGMPHPQQVTLERDGAALTGCGGAPARLLQGVEWVIEDINGGGIIDRSRVTLNFWQDGRVTGRASCNSLMGQYELTGEGLALSQLGTTRVACAPALMNQEQRVLNTLQQVQRFDFDETGALLLHAQEGTLKARTEY
ncbi:META domain-containing protein [Halopseudomonas pertucinogena]|uniref:META domain-containing protein n=1 Tax=Halopseudomonas pertucinogena TaxID=86175 RepID=A0ABQ2CSP8_9GAMM|nr:META domain-containing protein [Halopseudomonas pertucinogena]GGJ02325.1 hypothetical protein GCM10009083_18990 [Halopseudomonas pertucinogena]